MKYKLITFFILSCVGLPVRATTVYVTDTMKHTLRTAENNRSKIIKMLRSGTALTVINEDKSSGYTFVRTSDGKEGYILTRHTLKKPTSKWFLNKAKKDLELLQKKHETVNQQLASLTTGSNEALSTNQSLTLERNTLREELDELNKTASNAVQLKHQRDQLQERVISVERELEQLKRRNQTLEDSANQDWFLYGGILSLFGVILGFVIPKIHWPRRTSSWDTF